jgi:hypothetical protein
MDHGAREKHRLEFRETFAKTGHETLKALLIVSGGATVAYLTFLGATFGEENRFKTFGLNKGVGYLNQSTFLLLTRLETREYG